MSNWYEPDNKFNKIYMFIGNTVTIGSGVIGFFSWIVKAVTDNLEYVPKFIVVISTYILNFCIVSFVLGLFFLVARIVYVAIKSKTQAFYIQRKLSEFVHRELIHNIRNNIVELESLSEKIQRFSRDNNVDAITEAYNSEIEILKRNLKCYIDAMAEYLTEYRNSTISVCIKIFKKRNRNRNEFLSEEIISLVRSSNTEMLRQNTDSTYVGQNTDFTNLCRGQILFFASSNLRKIEESGQYINDSKNWENERYMSTLVTPIRYYNKGINDNSNKNIKFDIIGFLCIDSEDQICEWEHSDTFELELMAIFSDIIYVYIKEFYRCFESVGYNLS